MDIAILLPFIVLIGAMLLMTRSAKNKQRQAMAMRDAMEPGTGIRTIGGLYARVKEVREDTVLLEMAPGVHALFAKNAVGAVLDHDEYERIVSGEAAEGDIEVPDDASSLTEGGDRGEDGEPGSVDLGKDDAEADEDGPEAAEADASDATDAEGTTEDDPSEDSSKGRKDRPGGDTK